MTFGDVRRFQGGCLPPGITWQGVLAWPLGERSTQRAIAAIKEMGVLSGQRVERREVGPLGAFEALTDDELERALVERFSALGLTPDAGSDTRH